MWLELCKKAAAEWKTEGMIRVLEAFPRPRGAVAEVVGEHSEFEELEVVARGGVEAVALRALELLTAEVGATQAEVFVGRYRSLCRYLDQLAQRPEARLLAVGLYARLTEILSDGPPYVVRFRALVDFIYSHSAMVEWRHNTREERLPSAMEFFKQVTWERLAKGIRHASIQAATRDGPVHMDLLRIDQGKARFLATMASPEECSLPLHHHVAGRGGVAGFTGGFFLYSETDIEPPSAQFDPVGLLVSDGQVLSPPVLARPAFFQDQRGFVGITRLGMKGVLIRATQAAQVRVALVNPGQRKFNAPACFNRAFGRETQVLPGAALRVVGRRILSLHLGQSVGIPVNGYVLAFPAGGEWTQLAQAMVAAGSLEYELPPLPGFRPVVDAMAAGPTLLGQAYQPLISHAEEFGPGIPPVTLACDDTGDQNLLPRLAIGITPTFEVIVLAVDGRNLSSAFGATLGQMAHWMRVLGANQAVNLDGGSSKRMASGAETFGLSSQGLESGTPAPDSVRRLSSFFVVQAGHFSPEE